MDIRVAWTPSISDDVVVQKLTWLVNDEVVREVNLSPAVKERTALQDGVSFTEGDVVSVSIVANDGKSDSVATIGEVTVPLDPPKPVTDLVIELVDTP